MSAQQVIVERIRTSGPMTVAEFMDIALYDPEVGYYASRAQRSGRAGDFYTSVDVGPLFGACVAAHLSSVYQRDFAGRGDSFDLVEAAAGNGRLSKDILDAAQREFPQFYDAIRLTLVERSPSARAEQVATLGTHSDKLVATGETLPAAVRGAIVANELLDAMPCHVVTSSENELLELFVDIDSGSERLRVTDGPLSSRNIGDQLDRVGATLERGWIAEVSLDATRWTTLAAEAIDAGELLLLDYGHEARELYSAAHANGTLMRYCGHRADARWTERPGECDLTAHVDFTSVRLAAEARGLQLAAFTDQTRFLLETGVLSRLPAGRSTIEVRQRLAASSLLAPEGLGGTIKVMILRRGKRW
jgi:SAM-dependent MidA family methyltransferase